MNEITAGLMVDGLLESRAKAKRSAGILYGLAQAVQGVILLRK